MRLLPTLTVAFLAATAAAAQVTPPVPPTPPIVMTPLAPPTGMRALGSMSQAGRATILTAMRGEPAADRADRDRVSAARDRMLILLDAERLDGAALKRAMDDERDAANAMKARRQAAMYTALQSLSAADRRAFVADTRSLRDRVERRVEKRLHRRMTRHGAGDEMAPPPR